MQADNNEEELIARCRRGERRAWCELVKRYDRFVYSVAVSTGLTVDDAADVTQMTFSALLEGLDRIRLGQPDAPDARLSPVIPALRFAPAGMTKGKCRSGLMTKGKCRSGLMTEGKCPSDSGSRTLASWLATVARRHSWRLLAQRNREPTGLSEDVAWHVAETEPDESDPIGHWERLHALTLAFDRLDARCRNLITILYFDPEAPSYQDIASQFKMPVGSIGPTRARCLERLKHAFLALEPQGG